MITFVIIYIVSFAIVYYYHYDMYKDDDNAHASFTDLVLTIIPVLNAITALVIVCITLEMALSHPIKSNFCDIFFGIKNKKKGE